MIIIENTQKNKDEYNNSFWGSSEEVLTNEHIKALQQGKALAFNDGEYSHILTLKKD